MSSPILSTSCPKCGAFPTGKHCSNDRCAWRRCDDCPGFPVPMQHASYTFDVEHPPRGFFRILSRILGQA